MSYGMKHTVIGPAISPNLNLRASQADDCDDAAAAFGSRLLLRVDPRDIRKTADNPTGQRRVHYMMPNRDAAYFAGSGLQTGVISGKYAGEEVFILPGTGTTGAGTQDDMKIGPKSLSGKQQFTVFGVAHFDSSILGLSGNPRPIFALVRDKTVGETMFAHQYNGGINYLTFWGDVGDGGGQNINLDSGSPIAAGTPFFFMTRIIGTSPANSRADVFINNVDTATVGAAGVGVPEVGSMEFYLGWIGSDAQQWRGGVGRIYVVEGDTVATADDLALSRSLMMEMKALYGIA